MSKAFLALPTNNETVERSYYMSETFTKIIDGVERTFMKTRYGQEFMLPTDEEDARITAAALADPDSPPLTAEDSAKMRPLRELRPDLCAALVKWSSSKPEQDAPVKAKPAKTRKSSGEAIVAPLPAPA